MVEPQTNRERVKVDLFVTVEELAIIDKAVGEARQSRNQFVTLAALSRAKAISLEVMN